MKAVFKMLQVTLLGVAMSPAYAADIGSPKELGVALEHAALCKAGAADAFDARDKRVRQNLVRLGVKVHGDADDGPWDFGYVFPAGVSAFGYDVKAAGYSGDSGSIFYVQIAAAEADLDRLKDSLQLAPIPKAHRSDYLVDGAGYAKPVHPPTEDDPYPDTVVAGLQHKDGKTYLVVGCQTFDY